MVKPEVIYCQDVEEARRHPVEGAEESHAADVRRCDLADLEKATEYQGLSEVSIHNYFDLAVDFSQ